MALLAAFLLGVVLTGLALLLYEWLAKKVKRYRSAATLMDNRVTTVSQVLHLTVQGSPTGVTVVDRAGSVILSNRRAHDLGVVHERDVTDEIAKIVDHVYQDKESRTVDFRVPRGRTGSRVTSVRAVIQPLTLVDDRFVIIYATDESENVRMESARRDFVANVSHELKTPVGSMALLAEALQESTDDSELVEYFANKLHKEALRMGEMIAELISLSKLQGAEALPDMEPVNIDDVIDEALNRNRLAADNAGIELQRGRKAGVKVLGDRNLLVTAVSNLVSNAINYSLNSMPVTVSTKVDAQGSVFIRVTDRGIGIAPDDQKRVFERFFRVDKARSRSTGGTGLGLAIVKHVAANHGGRITLWSRVGTGSTFTLELPVHKDEPRPIEQREIEPNFRIGRATARRKDRA